MTHSPMRAVDLRCDWRRDPLGIDEMAPQLSWRLDDARPGARQSAYRITVVDARDGTELWDSGWVESAAQSGVVYAGAPLASRTRASWTVGVRDGDGVESAPSEPATFEMGLLERSDWQASWITAGVAEGRGTLPPAPVLHTTFEVGEDVVIARLYASAFGIYDVAVNGERVGDAWFRPGWTDYDRRVQYQTYDLAPHVRPGTNTVAITLGDGWYSGRVGWGDRAMTYGETPSLLAQVEITATDGSVAVVPSDATWRWHEGPVRRQDMIDGEEYDARHELDGDALATGGRAVATLPWPDVPVVAERCEPVRAVAELAPVGPPAKAFGGPGRDARIFDLGQNFTGVVRLRVRGRRGASVRLRYAEMLQDDGSLYTENLRSARATDWYTLKGDEAGETWTPRFTFHGFRYVEVSRHAAAQSAVDPFDESTVTGIALSSAHEVTGTFACSDDRVTQLQSNIQWGQRSNFLEVPTDCPQRDERLGWTGDAQVFAPTAVFNMDVAAFFAKWSVDLDDAQTPEGRLPNVVPAVLDREDGGPGWSDARVLCAWALHLATGDRRILERHYAAMAAWLEWQASTARDGVRCFDGCGYFQGYSDWLALDSTWQGVFSATPKDLIGTAYFAHTSGVLAEIARRLDHPDDAERFETYRSTAVEAFNREWVTPSGRLVAQTQTAHLMALAWDLLPDHHRPAAFDRLLALLAERDWHLSTGFLGTPLLCPVLTRFGRTDVAYRLLLDEEYPGWLFPVRNGATTMWERWNSWTPEHGFGAASMNSFNHYAYGAIGRWMYDVVGGIRIDESRPGYEHVLLAPEPDARLGWADVEHVGPRGPIRCRWEIDGEDVVVDVHVPPNTSATLRLPGREDEALVAGPHTVRHRLGVTTAAG